MNYVLIIEVVMEKILCKLVEVCDILFLGCGVMYLFVYEGVFKFKEISYIYVEVYVFGELKYGLIVLIDKKVLVVVLVLCDSFFDKIVFNM